ncbi:hypothetical protein AN936_14635 [Sphingopyxis macrogoltabida]|uniref:Uncharacterized protein n=1 Tax=Sphingopyxis macrogoltabida TaxID=33050 RepID=A0A0N9UDQ2_SPHMC|nr:hypothetical protein AN936_14635 [Sphingopyxis macrogoltabida]KTE17002.1 hypothetical protein ATE71_03145 [Sphingopyxis sp. H115]
MQANFVIAPGRAEGARPFHQKLCGIDEKERSAAVGVGTDGETVLAELAKPMIDFKIMATLEPAIMMVDQRGSACREGKRFCDRQALPEARLATTCWLVVG